MGALIPAEFYQSSKELHRKRSLLIHWIALFRAFFILISLLFTTINTFSAIDAHSIACLSFEPLKQKTLEGEKQIN